MLNNARIELNTANFKINGLSTDLLQLSIKLNIVMKIREQYEHTQSKMHNEIRELREMNEKSDDELRKQQIELIRLREEMSSKVIDEEVLRNKLADNQIILEQTMNNYDVKIKNLTISIEKQVEINET